MVSQLRSWIPRILVNLLLLSVVPACLAVNADWITPVPPFRIADNLYYVGSRDLAAYLVTTPAGDILINANYTSSPPQIRRSVEQLGFAWRDIKVLLISHAHVDHAGGAAQILRETGARFEVMDGDAEVMESGGKTDFAFGHQGKMLFPAAHVNRVLHDGDAIDLGGVRVVAHKTAGHTKGCTTFTLRVHLPGEPAATLRDVVIVGSWSVLSEYRLLAQHDRPSSYPGIAADYNHSFAVLATLPCDIFLASHGSTFDMPGKRKRMPAEGERVWIDPQGYKAAVTEARLAFEHAYEKQATAAAAHGKAA